MARGTIGLTKMKPNWDFLLDESSLASLLPVGYSHFVRPVCDGLKVFLGGLSEDEQVAILREQATLPITASISQRLGLLAQSSPVLQKLGQILARDQRLSPVLRQYLRELESLPPSVPLETIKEMLAQELGPLDRRGVTLLPPAIAEASVAVVIPFRQEIRGNGEQALEGVFKVLKPGIEERLEHELNLLERVGEHLDSRCDELQIPHLDYQEAFQQVRHKLIDEVHLENEQLHLLQAKQFFADEPQVRIPSLLDHCTRRVTSMERISGGKVTGHGLDRSRHKRRLAKLVAKSLIAKPVFSKSDQALFHADPHAGNLFLTDDGCLAILDWSLVSTLGASERIAIVQIVLGAMTLDSPRIVRVLTQLDDRQRADEDALKLVVDDWVKRVRRGQFPGLHWLVGLLDDAVQNARLRVSANLIMFRKSLHTLEGVVAAVGESSGQIDKTLSIEFLRHFAKEWPKRCVRLPNSRDYATRLSNLDVTYTLLSYPATVARFWTGHALDVLEACVSRWEASLAPPELSTSEKQTPVAARTDRE
jgi:ubiquinone biosynthesis protein